MSSTKLRRVLPGGIAMLLAVCACGASPSNSAPVVSETAPASPVSSDSRPTSVKSALFGDAGSWILTRVHGKSQGYQEHGGQESLSFRPSDGATSIDLVGPCGPINIEVSERSDRFVIVEQRIAASSCPSEAARARQEILLEVFGKGPISWEREGVTAKIVTDNGVIDLERAAS